MNCLRFNRGLSISLFDFFYVFIRYLAGRFPETAHAIDLDGRTPLHYAATLADNGHYYNLLLHLGANPLVQDNVSAILIMIMIQWFPIEIDMIKFTKDYIFPIM